MIFVGAVLFLVGWVFVLVSGHGGNSPGGSEAAWTIGGAMVYASIPTIVAGVVYELVGRLRAPG